MNSIESTAVVAIGSNLGEPKKHLLDAHRDLIRLKACKDFIFSPIYKTKPVACANAPYFLNAVASFTTTLKPAELLESLLLIESNNGRIRTGVNGARTLDLDLILHGDTVIDSKTLSLPHPRFHERFFVLIPLNDIRPDFVHPLLNKSIKNLLQSLAKDNDVNQFAQPFCRAFSDLS